MTLPLYSTFLSFPGGSPASNFPVSIFPRASNQLALLFEDEDGTTPAPNPLTTTSDGEATFYAAPGDYIALLGGERFSVPLHESVSFPVWPDVWVHTQSAPASGWSVEHHFGIHPSVDVIISGDETLADVSHPDTETTFIMFGTPVTGVAYLRR